MGRRSNHNVGLRAVGKWRATSTASAEGVVGFPWRRARQVGIAGQRPVEGGLEADGLRPDHRRRAAGQVHDRDRRCRVRPREGPSIPRTGLGPTYRRIDRRGAHGAARPVRWMTSGRPPPAGRRPADPRGPGITSKPMSQRALERCMGTASCWEPRNRIDRPSWSVDSPGPRNGAKSSIRDYPSANGRSRLLNSAKIGVPARNSLPDRTSLPDPADRPGRFAENVHPILPFRPTARRAAEAGVPADSR